jgi:hypothetical protein
MIAALAKPNKQPCGVPNQATTRDPCGPGEYSAPLGFMRPLTTLPGAMSSLWAEGPCPGTVVLPLS